MNDTKNTTNIDKHEDMQSILEMKRKEAKMDSAEDLDAMWDRSLEFFEQSAKEVAQ